MKEQLPKLIPYRKKDKWGFCDRHKNIKIPVQFDFVGDFHEGLVKVQLNNKWGFINEDGSEVT